MTKTEFIAIIIDFEFQSLFESSLTPNQTDIRND